MSSNLDYWTLSSEQYDKYKSRIVDLGHESFEILYRYGFTKIENPSNWLGFIISLRNGEIKTFVSFSLYSEDPIEFRLMLKQWNELDPPKTSVVFYEKYFSTLEEIENNLTPELGEVYKKLEVI